MTTLLQVLGLSHAEGRRTLFENLDLTIRRGEHIGLVGHNGSGKSTLLALLAGTRVPDRGELRRSRETRIGLVEQFLPAELMQRRALEAVSSRLCDPHQTWRAQSLLERLGFTPETLEARLEQMSGGQRNRVMFARAVVEAPDLLLLDEPSNHLDLATLVVFESFLRELSGAFVLVSHDRAFLDAVTGQTWLVRDGRVYHFRLACSAARAELAEADRAAARARAAETRRIDAVKASAKRLAIWGRTYDNEDLARRAKSMEKRVERMEAEQTFVSRGSPLELDLDLAGVRSRRVLEIESLEVPVPGDTGRTLFCIEHLIVRPGERVALLGHNGVGKTTLIALLVQMWRRAEEGAAVRFSPQVRLGYYDQELDEVDGSQAMHAFVSARAQVDDRAARQALIKAGFAYVEHDKRVCDLSGGERARVLFVVLSLDRPSLLVLDEPTNHIDIDGKEQLEAQLLSGDATLLLTSHDRRFIETVANRFLWIHDGALRELSAPGSFFADRPRPPERVRPGARCDPATTIEDPETLLERIVALETRLAQDQARKARFQKPALQARWRAELAELNERLARH